MEDRTQEKITVVLAILWIVGGNIFLAGLFLKKLREVDNRSKDALKHEKEPSIIRKVMVKQTILTVTCVLSTLLLWLVVLFTANITSLYFDGVLLPSLSLAMKKS